MKKDYFYLLILLFIAAVNFNLFVKPYNFVCGGTNGLAIIIHKLVNVDYFIIILSINVLMFLLSSIFLNKKVTISLIISTISYPLFIKFTSFLIIEKIPIILSIIMVGIISGITNGVIYKLGFTTGGINIIPPLLNKYFGIKFGTINFLVNFIIMFLNLILFGLDNLIYSIIIIIINSITINLIIYKKIL